MAIESSASDDGRELDTVESEDIDLAALMKRYQGSLSVSVSEEEGVPISLKQVDTAASDDKDTDDVDYDDLDEDEYAARANDIMKRYKMQFALSDDTEDNSSDEDDTADDDVDETEPARESVVDRADDLVNKSRQLLESSKADREKEEEEEDHVDNVVADLLADVEIGEEIAFEETALEQVQSGTGVEEHFDEVESKTGEVDVLEQIEPKTEEEEGKEVIEIEEEIKLETKSGSAEEEELEAVEIDEEIQLESGTGSAEEEEMEDVEIDEEIQEDEVEASTVDIVEAEVEESSGTAVEAEAEASSSQSVAEVVASSSQSDAEVEASTSKITEAVASAIKSVAEAVSSSTSKSVAEVALSTSKSVAEVASSTSNSVAEAEASSNDAVESEELEEMITKLTQENEVLKKKKEMKKRIYQLEQENDQLKMSPQRNALANMAIKFDDAVANAVARVSKIMVCAPEDEDIFEEGFPEESVGDENKIFAVDPASDFGRLEYKQKQVLSPVSHMTDENTTSFLVSAPAPPNSYQLKMQAYHQKYKDPIKPRPAVTVKDVLKEARLASGVGDDEGEDAMRRVEEAKLYIKNRSVLKMKGNI